MSWKMDANGNWTRTSGGGEKSDNSQSKQTETKPKVIADKGNTSDTNKSIKESTNNKTEKISYAEEADFRIIGDFSVRKGGLLRIGKGVANRWKGTWRVLSTTHTVDNRGYFTEGKLGRVPYKPETTSSTSENKSSSNRDKSSIDTKPTQQVKSTSDISSESSSTSSNTKAKWKMNSSGVWTKG